MKWVVVSIVGVLIVAGAVALVVIPSPQKANAPTTEPAALANLITVAAPLPNAKVSSPLSVSGQARGNWFFEASAPVELKDANGTVIAQVPAQAQGDWMTSEYVPFAATLTFPTQPAGSKGTLVLKNDNPSGDPSRQKELDIPVSF